MAAASNQRKLQALALRVFQFAIVSGLGLAIDFGLFIILTNSGLGAGASNLISACIAVAFVYFASVKKVFAYEGGFLVRLFVIYAVYQVLAISIASFAVEILAVQAGLGPFWAKALTLPFTFSVNYLFASWLTREKSA